MAARENLLDIFSYEECVTEVYKAERIGADWSTAEKQGKLVVVVSIKASLEQFISLFTARKNRLSILQTTHKFSFLILRFPSRKTVGNNFFLQTKIISQL